MWSVRPGVLVLALAGFLAGCASVAERATEPSTSDIETPRGGSADVVAVARKYIGAPYRWGGSSPSGFDCSGLVRYAYAQVGVELPHNAAKQYALGVPVEREDLQPGDIVFFDRLRHNGIYIGGGRFIHARQTGKRVAVAGLDEAWYATHWVGARRIDLVQPVGDDQEW